MFSDLIRRTFSGQPLSTSEAAFDDLPEVMASLADGEPSALCVRVTYDSK